MPKLQSRLPKDTQHKNIGVRDVRARLDECIYAITFIISQRQMRKRWAS